MRMQKTCLERTAAQHFFRALIIYMRERGCHHSPLFGVVFPLGPFKSIWCQSLGYKDLEVTILRNL